MGFSKLIRKTAENSAEPIKWAELVCMGRCAVISLVSHGFSSVSVGDTVSIFMSHCLHKLFMILVDIFICVVPEDMPQFPRAHPRRPQSGIIMGHFALPVTSEPRVFIKPRTFHKSSAEIRFSAGLNNHSRLIKMLAACYHGINP